MEVGVVDYWSFLQRTGILDDEIVSCYVIGSHAYGNATAKSDLDIMVVCKPTAFNKWMNFNWYLDHGWAWRGYEGQPWLKARRTFIGTDEFQAWIHTQATWEVMVANYIPFAVECAFLPAHCVWKERRKYLPPETLNPQLLVSAYCGVAEAHKERAFLEFVDHEAGNHNPHNAGRGWLKLKTEGFNLYKSKKTLFNCIRILRFGLQLLNHNLISDFACANEVKVQLLKVKEEDWAAHWAVCEKMYKELTDDLQASLP